jgi:hypothetical protein
MSLLSTVQDAMAVCGFARPTIVYASTNQLEGEFMTFATMAGQYELDHAWRGLKVTAQLEGDGSSTEFGLPADFENFMPGYPLWLDRTPSVPLRKVSDEQMLAAKISLTAPLRPIWRTFGEALEFYPAPVDGEVIKLEYRSNYWILDESGTTRKTAWTADTDYSVIPERLLVLSIIWRWKESKGLPYAEDFRNWQIARSKLTANHNSAVPIRIGRPLLHPGLATGVYGDVPEIIP